MSTNRAPCSHSIGTELKQRLIRPLLTHVDENEPSLNDTYWYRQPIRADAHPKESLQLNHAPLVGRFHIYWAQKIDTHRSVPQQGRGVSWLKSVKWQHHSILLFFL